MLLKSVLQQIIREGTIYKMFICIAGKNNIAVDILTFLLDKYGKLYEFGVVCNKSETGKNAWQKSLRFCAREKGVREYKLEEIYQKKNVIFLSLEFDRIVKPELFKDARLYNIHFSLLPKFKGMYTSAIPILEGEKYTGVTFHKIDRGIDTGDIIKQKKFKLKKSYTSRDVYLQYIQNGTKVVLECIDKVIDGNVDFKQQKSKKSTYYSKKYIDYSNVTIDLLQTADVIERQIRAFCFREYQLPKVYNREIIAARITDIKSCSKPGTIVIQEDNGMMLSTIDYNIVLYFDRFSELMKACTEGDIRKVKDICAVKEHINTSDRDGLTPLIVSTCNNHLDIAKYLIMNGADILVKDNNGKNLLMYAQKIYAVYKDIELFRMFYNLGLDVKECDYSGRTLEYYLNQEGYTLKEMIDLISL